MENNEMYLSTNLSDKILEGTYIIQDDNTIEFRVLKVIKDYEFYTSSMLKIEDIFGEKNIVILNNDQNKEMHYQKIR